ncbi:unnamed protein product [Durusdinium trenchii]|uniref:Uncharacterized protein n=1 Tax=Durusdinium trenchii TaxID=1381693 RepID=A0ABP0PAP2_9DINO
MSAGGAALRGRVVEVLPCAVLLEELSGSSARYLALRQGLEELRVGMPVNFQVSWQPGLSEAAGYLRASRVAPATPVPRSASSTARTIEAAEIAETVDAVHCIDGLAASLEEARAKEDGNLMCEVLGNCVDALKVATRVPTRTPSELKLLHLLWRSLNSLELSGPTLLSLRPALDCCAALGAHCAARSIAWHRVEALLRSPSKGGERSTKAVPKRWEAKCNVEGCASQARGRVKDLDLYGPAGPRCCLHGARRCNVFGCSGFARAAAARADRWGPAGRRCPKHCTSWTRWCNVSGCLRFPRGLVDASDALGPAGHRCDRHGCGCRVAGCSNAPWGHGALGRACWLHGGTRCTAQEHMGESCVRPPRRRVAQGDEHGPPGARCDLHSGTTRGTARCFGPHRVRSQPETVKPETAKEQCMAIRHYRGKRGQKKLWRCGKEKCGSSRYCLHHEAAIRERIRKDSERRRERRKQLKDAK